MKIKEFNCETKEIIERNATPEEIAIFAEHEQPKEIIPESVSSRQLRLQLLNEGIKLAEIDDIINMVSEPQKSALKIQWEYSATFNRYDPVLIEMASLINIDEVKLDDIFIKASLL